jgi:hypothetical protein
MMKQSKPLGGRKKLISLSGQMAADLKAYCHGRAIHSESELIRQAIAKYIYADYQDESLKLQGLNELSGKTGELRDMIDILFRYIRLMHINLLAYQPELDPELADPAFHSATTRHNKFFEAFRDSLKNDPPFFERLLHTYFSGDSRGQD